MFTNTKKKERTTEVVRPQIQIKCIWILERNYSSVTGALTQVKLKIETLSLLLDALFEGLL
jgi:hypothetical protein